MKKYLCFCAAALLYVSCGHIKNTSNYPNAVADIDPFSLGSVKVSLNQALSSKLKETVVEVVFYPRENEVALEFQDVMTRHRQFWNEAGRGLFIQALDLYKEDFASQTLAAGNNKSRSAYGKIKSRFEWKTLKFSPTYKSSPFIELGYRFIEGAPYFYVNQLKAREETGVSEGVKESPQSAICFTRAQGEDLARLFAQAFLLESLDDRTPEAPGDPERDEYYQQ